MTIILEIPPETEATLTALAAARGVSLDELLQIIITTDAAAIGAKAVQPAPRDAEDLDRVIDEIFDTVQVPPGVGEGIMRRENWYR